MQEPEPNPLEHLLGRLVPHREDVNPSIGLPKERHPRIVGALKLSESQLASLERVDTRMRLHHLDEGILSLPEGIRVLLVAGIGVKARQEGLSLASITVREMPVVEELAEGGGRVLPGVEAVKRLPRLP